MGRWSTGAVHTRSLRCFEDHWAPDGLLALLARRRSVDDLLALEQELVAAAVLVLRNRSSTVIGSGAGTLAHEMMLRLLVHLLEHLLLVHLVGVEESMAASLASALRAAGVVLETCLPWNDAPLAALHLDLRRQSHSCCA